MCIRDSPGLMPEDEYDLAGFAVGVIDKKDLLTGKELKAGDVLIGMASTGVHSNGFSLVRKVFDMTRESLDTYYDCLLYTSFIWKRKTLRFAGGALPSF